MIVLVTSHWTFLVTYSIMQRRVALIIILSFLLASTYSQTWIDCNLYTNEQRNYTKTRAEEANEDLYRAMHTEIFAISPIRKRHFDALNCKSFSQL